MPKTEWDYTGHFTCQFCPATFQFAREAGFPEDWVLDVAHVHPEELEPYWESTLVRRWKGRRMPPQTKAVRQVNQNQKREAAAAAKLAAGAYKKPGIDR